MWKWKMEEVPTEELNWLLMHFSFKITMSNCKDYEPETIELYTSAVLTVTSSYIGGEVSVCDSLSNGSLTDSLSLQLVELYHPALWNGMLMVTLLPVQQQEETWDCGLFCIANAYSVAMGENHHIDYNQSAMRSHLEECFEKEELSPFPPSTVPVKSLDWDMSVLRFIVFVRDQSVTTW